MAADDVRCDPVGPVFEFLERSGTAGMAQAWARRDLDMAAAPAARHELTALLAPADGPEWVLVHLGVTCMVEVTGIGTAISLVPTTVAHRLPTREGHR